MHGHGDAVDAGEGEPEMNLAERFVQAAAKHFREPEKQGGENRECGGDAHDEMEMAGDEIVTDSGSGEIMAGEGKHGEGGGEKKRKGNKKKKDRGGEGEERGAERGEATQKR